VSSWDYTRQPSRATPTAKSAQSNSLWLLLGNDARLKYSTDLLPHVHWLLPKAVIFG